MRLDSSNSMRRHRNVITSETTDGLGTFTQTVPKKTKLQIRILQEKTMNSH